MDTGTWGLYYNYTWWGNAIQTAPSVIGKPDFFGSQFEMLTSQQPNQVVNGDFATDSDWSKVQSTISNGKATIISPDGSYAGIYQNILTVGKTYTYNIAVSSVTNGVSIFSGSSLNTLITSAGNYQGTFVATNVRLEIKRNNDDIMSASIDNVSVQIVRADNVEAVKCLADWIHETQILDV